MLVRLSPSRMRAIGAIHDSTFSLGLKSPLQEPEHESPRMPRSSTDFQQAVGQLTLTIEPSRTNRSETASLQPYSHAGFHPCFSQLNVRLPAKLLRTS